MTNSTDLHWNLNLKEFHRRFLTRPIILNSLIFSFCHNLITEKFQRAVEQSSITIKIGKVGEESVLEGRSQARSTSKSRRRAREKSWFIASSLTLRLLLKCVRREYLKSFNDLEVNLWYFWIKKNLYLLHALNIFSISLDLLYRQQNFDIFSNFQ